MVSRNLLWLFAVVPFLAVASSRIECGNYSKTRQPFFGELHLHTEYSADAATLDTRNTPRDAYRFAKGEKVGLPPFVDTRTTRSPDSEQNTQYPPVNGVAQHPYCLPPDRCEFTATRTAQLPKHRALDFAAITDHSEFLGEANICFFEGGAACTGTSSCTDPGQVCSPLVHQCVPRGYDGQSCIVLRQELSRIRPGGGDALLSVSVSSEFPRLLPFCNEPGANGEKTCAFQSQNVWQEIQAAAAEANNPCDFTSFIAYEYTAQPGMGSCAGTGNPPPSGAGAPCWVNSDCPSTAPICNASSGGSDNLHRNIIFRTDSVPKQPVSTVDAPTGCGSGTQCATYRGADRDYLPGAFSTDKGVTLGSPQVMLKTLSEQCNAGNDCEFLSIPHNPNISGGAMFLEPESREDAAIRSEFEPLVEIFQIKGGSECRFSAQSPGLWGTFDELCSFENLNFGKLGGPFIAAPDETNILPNSFVRNVLKSGLQYQQKQGINPFRLGFVGATDNHNGTPSDTEAAQYAKTGAHGDLGFAESGAALNETFLVGLESNGGGLTGVWAEENTRDSIFAALKRRETFATSSTRPVVRMFGGFNLPADMCRRGEFAARGYANGVPMGGLLPAAAYKESPRFAVAAMMDMGLRTPLQRIQIIKGWVDKDGGSHEEVYDVAGGPNDASVDLKSCKSEGKGAANLCGVWADPDFDRAEKAFYYARVLENPSCRWNQYYCNSRSIDCDKPPKTGGNMPRYTDWEYQQCCSTAVPKTVQQRAWTSPIWYSPRTEPLAQR